MLINFRFSYGGRRAINSSSLKKALLRNATQGFGIGGLL